jgi:hypothetical protein
MTHKVGIGTLEEVPGNIDKNDLVLDVGGGLRPLSRANYVLDCLPWNPKAQLTPKFRELWPTPLYSPETWVQRDLCDHADWPFSDKQFDFVFCSHTLEDVRDPVRVCEQIIRVGKRGYIEVPNRIVESLRGIERTRYCGYSHHHWLCDVTDSGIEFLYKHAQLHAYSRFHLTVGMGTSAGGASHRWTEAFDFAQPLFVSVNRWFRRVNPKYFTVGLFWTDSFSFKEKLFIDKGDVEADLMAFKDKCRDIPDLWIWK